MFFHILRETTPCSLLTPLLVFDMRMASTVMLKFSCSLLGCSRPRFRNVVAVDFQALDVLAESTGPSCGRGRRRCRPARACAS